MARTKLSKHLSQAEIHRFLTEAERLHKSIVQPLLSPSSEHYRALQNTHEALLKTIKDITGRGCAVHSVERDRPGQHRSNRIDGTLAISNCLYLRQRCSPHGC
ncbi:hypothetical protein [Mesorhizobium sp. M1406]|uniref:hypothetical protein n=1 Tax=Mesorhizobium sp. M1406 TaxID=2957099 RepID=UPI00333D5F1C